MELALATGTAPGQWINESDEILATALDVLDVQAEQIKARTKRR